MACEAWGGKAPITSATQATADCLCSATLDLAYTAMGSFDIWWEGGCWEWYVDVKSSCKSPSVRVLTLIGMLLLALPSLKKLVAS